MTLADMAKSLGVSVDYFRRMERGQFNAKYELVQLWAKVLGFDVELRLVTFTQPPVRARKPV